MNSWVERARRVWSSVTANSVEVKQLSDEDKALSISQVACFCVCVLLPSFDGLWQPLITYLEELVKHPLTWMEFPMATILEAEGIDLNELHWTPPPDRPLECPLPLFLSPEQVRHGELVLEHCPELGHLRNRLCPRVMDDEVFWKIYFLLVRRHVKLPERLVSENPLPSLRESDGVSWAPGWEQLDNEGLCLVVGEHSLPDNQVRLRVYARLLSEQHCHDCESGNCEVLLRNRYHDRFGLYPPVDILFPPRVNPFVRTIDMLTAGPHCQVRDNEVDFENTRNKTHSYRLPSVSLVV
jgi:hypothetical protein